MKNGKKLLETKRLILRELISSDLPALFKILRDEEVMHSAYESAFSLEEAQNWMGRQFIRYSKYGFGLWV